MKEKLFILKRELFLALISLILSSCLSSESSIEGKISGVDWDKIYLYSREQKNVLLDSAFVKDGEFHFNTDTIKSQLCLIGNGRTFTDLFVINSSMQVSLSVNEGKITAEVSGSPEHLAYKEFREKLANSEEALNLQKCSSQLDEAIAAKNDSLKEILNLQYEQLNSAYWELANSEEDKIIEKYHNSPLGIHFFYRRNVYFKNFYTQSKIDSVRDEYKGFGTLALKSAVPEIIEAYLIPYEKSTVGKVAPDFSGTDINGKVRNLSDMKGKFILVDFWASWCYWCRQETPNLKEAFQNLDKEQFEIVGVSFDLEKEKWMKAIEEDQTQWMQLIVTREEQNRIKQEYSFSGIPHIILLDPEGKIVARDLRGEEIVRTIEEQLLK